MGDFLLAQSFPTPSHMHAGSFFYINWDFFLAFLVYPLIDYFFKSLPCMKSPPSPSPSHHFSHGPSQNGVSDPGLRAPGTCRDPR